MSEENILNQEEHITEKQIDPYLKSQKAFHLEMPLYNDFDLSKKLNARIIYKHLTHGAAMDAFCIYCKKDSVFKFSKNYDERDFEDWVQFGYGLTEIEYHCTRLNAHRYYIYYFKQGKLFTKVGQFPSVADFQIPQIQRYRKILGEEQFKELTRGIGLASHGVGIGSFVYLRRIFENLIEEAHSLAQAEDEKFKEIDYIKARMDEKIKIVKNFLPEFLVENRSIYTILSKGIHELSEDECLHYFEAVKIGIEQILDEKIIQKDKAEKNSKARTALQDALGKISKS
ncbi:MAG: short-chain dehydrogenase [Candidatus Marinimicrobia bacterium]|nr:short-chain dehydrogenase [Candidatus Neomarinimicrobiota bacterium]